MRKRSLSLVLLGVVAAAVLAGSAAAIAASWGAAIEVPGTATLNSGGSAEVYSVSCAVAGQCAAGGYYKDGSGYQAFVASSKRGGWGHAVEVPGTATLNSGAYAKVNVVSCAAAGECSAGGFYKDGSSHFQAFVVNEKRGRWGKAIKVPGMATLNKGGSGFLYAISCVAAGECEAGGTYRNGAGRDQAFLVRETHGRWGRAFEVPGTAALNTGNGSAAVVSVSCVAVGECAAGGGYTDGASHNQAFVVKERHGRWGKAIELPGTATLNVGGFASVKSVSCAAVGECGAVGFYKDGSGNLHAFVASEKRGRWSHAVEVPGMSTLNTGDHANAVSVSCRAAGECAAGGYYVEGSGSFQAFVVSETHGSWGTAVEVPGTATLNSGGSAAVNSVSCVSAGACVAGGYYLDGSGSQAFVASESHGIWSDAVELPGTATLNSGSNAKVYSVSCVVAGACAAGGSYKDVSAMVQALVVTGTTPKH